MFGEVDRRGVKHETSHDTLPVSQGRGMGRAVGVELRELVDELSKGPLQVRWRRPCVGS